MTLYTLFPCHSDGTATTFATFELADAEAAYQQAAVMLEHHLSAAYVAVWCGEQKVCSVARKGGGAAAIAHHAGPELAP